MSLLTKDDFYFLYFISHVYAMVYYKINKYNFNKCNYVKLQMACSCIWIIWCKQYLVAQIHVIMCKRVPPMGQEMFTLSGTPEVTPFLWSLCFDIFIIYELQN